LIFCNLSTINLAFLSSLYFVNSLISCFGQFSALKPNNHEHFSLRLLLSFKDCASKMKSCVLFIAFAAIFLEIATMPVVEDGSVFFREENELGSSEILTHDGEGIEAEKVNMKLESGQFFQGDIVLVPDQEDLLSLNSTGSDDDLQSRTGILLENQRWPKNEAGFVVMPYSLSTVDYSEILN
jgi:hypothetical protein